MEKVFNTYETLFIVKPDLSEEETKVLIDKYSALIAENGTVESIDVWGKRRLAYQIGDCTEGCYVLTTFKSEASLPAELRRLFGIDDKVLRAMVIKVDEKKKAVAAKVAETEAVAEEAPVAEEPAAE